MRKERKEWFLWKLNRLLWKDNICSSLRYDEAVLKRQEKKSARILDLNYFEVALKSSFTGRLGGSVIKGLLSARS